MNEQIKELAEVLCMHYGTELCRNCGAYDKCMVRIDAETIYAAGYCKKTEVVREIIREIAEKLKYSNQIFGDCASRLVSPAYADGRCDAYEEFIDILNGLVGKYLFEETKDENT